MSEDLMSDLWEMEEGETEEGKKKKSHKKEKHPRQRTPEISLKGFGCCLGTLRKKMKNKTTGKLETVDAPIVIVKDPRCWILKVGNDTIYPSSLTGVFMAIANQDIELEGLTTADEVITALAETRDRIVERIADLERRVEEWDKTEQYKMSNL